MDVRELDRRAVRGGIEVVERVTEEDLGRATPCAGWTVADLLAHMTAQHHGFAAAARGEGADPRVWEPRPAEAGPVADYVAAAERVLAAFADDGVLARRFDLPEFGPGASFRAERAIGFHLIDYVVHGWDVARAIGAPYAPAPDLVAAVVPIAQAVPDDENRLAPGAAFRPGLASPADAPPFDQVLALLGRSPAWRPAAAEGHAVT
ncbi:MAG TPA: TIGR03086 family metal-binding protein [Streptosporangiaceae bacterium]|jgi:uncharacterized protein (TIGR03086 family)